MRGASLEPELIRKASGGDARAFEQLIEMHYDFIHATAWKWTRSRCDADDIAQQMKLLSRRLLQRWFLLR